jgi:hypothetical protein
MAELIDILQRKRKRSLEREDSFITHFLTDQSKSLMKTLATYLTFLKAKKGPVSHLPTAIKG